MPITKVVPDGQGGAWGWDTDTNDWVPVDPQAAGGSFLGNLGRAAGRGFEGLGAGVRQAADPADEAARLDAEAYQMDTQAAERVAPWAEGLGQAAPDIAAGGAAAALTGGASIPIQLGAQALAGGLSAAARPGSTEERLANAAWGAGLAIAGGVIAPAALKGITAALEIGRGIQGKTAVAMADGIEAGGMRLDRARAAAAAQGAEGAGVSQAPGGAGSVGAAATPEEQIPAYLRAESQALDLDEAQGTSIGEWTAGQRRIAEDATALGYKIPSHYGTPRGSASRIVNAGREYLPGAAEMEQGRIASNNALKNRAFAKAAGFTDDLEDARYNAVDDDLIARMQDNINRDFEEVAKEMPAIEGRKVLKLFDKIDDSEAPLVGGQAWDSLKSGVMQNIAKNPEKPVSSTAYIRTTQQVGKAMAEAFKDGDQYSGEMLMQLQNSLYDLAEGETKRAPSRYGKHGRDPQIVGKDWAELRQNANLYRMITRPGAVGPDGTINSRTLYNAMRAEKKNGGFGRKGPLPDSRLRDLWTVLQADTMSEPMVPATGARLALQLAVQKGAPAAAGGLAGVAGLSALSNLWGR